MMFGVNTVSPVDTMGHTKTSPGHSDYGLTQLAALTRMKNPLIAGRIPHSWLNQIDKICQETGKNRSEILKEALGQYLDKTDPSAVTSMHRRLNTLEKQFKKLLAVS